MPGSVEQKVEVLANELKNRGWMVVTAESCTGGMIASAITDRAGSSSVFDRGFVTYSNESKQEMLNVSREILENQGAVSAECAEAMAEGALSRSHAQIAVAVTGIAGPGGGTPEKPVGLVYIGWAVQGGLLRTEKYLFSGNRTEIRAATMDAALSGLISCLNEKSYEQTIGKAI